MPSTIPQMFIEKAKEQPEMTAQLSKDAKGVFMPTSYDSLLGRISRFAAGLRSLGVKRGDKIGFISDNRKEWLVADLAILGLGAADVPRGCDATTQEISHILSWSECTACILENDKQLAKILEKRNEMPLLATVILIDPPSKSAASHAAKAKLELLAYDDVMARATMPESEARESYIEEAMRGSREDLATLIYTSGTTGDPKGVMLSHANFLHQTDCIPAIVGIKSGEVFLSVLPVWHSFERIVQYVVLRAGAAIAYSKPVGSILLADMQLVQPHWFTSVPRIWETVKDGIYKNIRQGSKITRGIFKFFVGTGKIYAYFRNHLLRRVPEFTPRSRLLEIASSIVPFALLWPLWKLGDLLVYRKVKDKLGKRFIAGVSGGGALPPSIDRFFDALGILILEGYGLTETAPVLGVRLKDHPVIGTVGPILKGTEIRIVDEGGQILGAGRKGVIQVRGPQVMQGYYRRPDLTAKVMTTDGWLDTGDLGMITINGEIRITGRAKDTIVLRGGENIEPVPIEQKLCESRFILQSVVLGQDERYLAALVVPRQESIVDWAEENNIPFEDYETLIQQPEIRELIDAEITGLISQRNGFKAFERIFRFDVVAEPFQQGRELSAKLEVRRHVVNEMYRKKIRAMFAASR